MTVLSVEPANTGLNGHTKGTDAQSATRGHRATFRVHCNAADTWEVIDAYFRGDSELPYNGRIFKVANGQDTRSRCTELRGTFVSNSQWDWLVEATYEENLSSFTGPTGQDGQGRSSDNPFDWHDKIQVITTQMSVGVEAALFKHTDPPNMIGPKLAEQRNKFIPVANSAGVPLDPGIEEELDLTIIRITKHQPIYSTIFVDVFRNTVNGLDAVIRKPAPYNFEYPIPAYQGKIKSIDSDWAVTPKGIVYWTHTIEVHINPLGWRRRIADKGIQEVFFPEETLPDGTTLSNSDLPAGQGHVHQEIKDLEGMGISTPVPFNGKGKRLKIGEPFVWLIYQTLREADWSGINW